MAELPLFFASLALLFLSGVDSTTFTIKNNCKFTIWPASTGGNGQLSLTGFELAPGASKILDAPPTWSGRIWGRTGCSTDASGRFTCQTADCANKLLCAGASGAAPSTLVELTLGATDFYDVSLVDGFNLPVAIAPQGGAGNCVAPACAADVNLSCPPELATKGPNGEVIGCRSACNVFTSPQYCCTGEFGTPDKCHPSNYSEIFKGLCPQAYSYAYDDKTSTFICIGNPNYVVTFCP